eukprot:NODE_6354_length_579_cov_21.875472_g5941_i0.p1 GENE.NODE_6354_length_579_cov_21.875472_g5941_i0~~NODE_6354_length_579_cov_21.875472_g5941_i0.p1  ORF type:complete len:134 (-),score=30.08 NODE_6354_length_579_cov_21.875472_g5941_i0:19-420(-)
MAFHQINRPVKKAIFAIVHVTAHQYKISPGDIIQTEKLLCDVGEVIRLNKVLMVGTSSWTAIGKPLLEGTRVIAAVEEQQRSEKIVVFKKKRRKGYQRWNGHRQDVTHLRILDVQYAPDGVADEVNPEPIVVE